MRIKKKISCYEQFFYCVCFSHFVSYSIQALFTQRGRLPSTSLSLRGLTYAEVRVIQVLASRVLKKNMNTKHYTHTHDKNAIIYHTNDFVLC